MKGLILKDLYYIKNNIKLVLLMMVFWALLYLRSNTYVQGLALICFILGMLSIGTITVDERGNWNKYALTMPISRKKLILEKYLFINGIVILFFTVALAGAMMFFGMFSLENFFIGTVTLSILLIFLNIQIYLLYRFGAEKSTIYFFIIIAIVVGAGYLIYKFLPEVASKFLNLFNSINFTVIGVIAILISILFMTISFLLTNKYINSKEY